MADAESQIANPKDQSLAPPRSAAFQSSYAYKSVQTRLPVTLTKIVDHLSRYKDEISSGNYRTYLHDPRTSRMSSEEQSSHQNEREEELKQIVGALSKLRNEVQTNKLITPFPIPPETGDHRNYFADLPEWNKALHAPAAQNLLYADEQPKWFESPWMFVEAYLYRRVMYSVQQTTYLHDMDPFQWEKAQSIEDNQENIGKILKFLDCLLKDVIGRDASSDAVAGRFKEILKLSLWGNEGDLSHPVGKKCCDSDSSHHTDAKNSKEKKSDVRSKERILVMDQTDEIWNYLSKLRASSQPMRIDIVCDNAGLELITDLVFGTFLLETKLASVIHYHVMQLPCYVSDATVSDFYHAIQLAKQHNPQISAKWEEYLHNGQFIVKSDGFWSLPWDFDHMAQRAPELYRDLATASLIIFKGDLNYRKLDGDLQWPPATPMQRGVRGFAPAAWCVLRALKGDTVVGLPKGRAEEMQAQDDNWMTTGNFAVVQFFRQKPA